MKKVYRYPAIFELDTEVGGYMVHFPDLKGCITEGDTLEEAYGMALEALGGWMAAYMGKNKTAPKATPLTDIKVGKDDSIMLVEVDSVYLAQSDSKAVKKTLTIPRWLNTAAEQRNINFSRVLQEALEKEVKGLNVVN